jgi:hypothetical protein
MVMWRLDQGPAFRCGLRRAAGRQRFSGACGSHQMLAAARQSLRTSSCADAYTRVRGLSSFRSAQPRRAPRWAQAHWQAAAAAAAAAAAVGGVAVALQPAAPASCRGKTANEPLGPRHRVSIVAGVLRNAVWEKDPRCRDLPTLLQHLKTSGYDGTETGCGDLIMCFYQDKSPEDAIPIIREEFRRAGLRPVGANYLVTDEPRAADGTTSNTYPKGNVRQHHTCAFSSSLPLSCLKHCRPSADGPDARV